MIEDAADSVRRMQANEEFDKDGLRTIWHRGRQRTEMLSWENQTNQIVRQELSIFGMVVEFRRGEALRTGRIPSSDTLSNGGKPMSHLIKMDDKPDKKILTYASHLLKHIKGRDFYAQHLLREVNDAIASLGYDAARTAVAHVDRFARKAGHLPTMDVDAATLKKARGGGNKTILFALGLTLLGVGIGVGIAFALGLFE
ncbi:MAG TPA: hypothetical protein VKA53_09915 [Thermoanaerobaculia bacterium]|nr:hypothetical protein [Thermoanaerobaculia bacterium]